MAIKETRKKLQRTLEHMADTENRDVVVRELRHVMETCSQLIYEAERAPEAADKP